jgi:biopolymer transport protein ExbD
MAKKAAPEINAGSMADIAFLLLIFFLVTTTMDVDTGITRKLPPPVPKDEEPPQDVKERNVLKILLNSRNDLMVDGKRMDISLLKDKTKDFMAIHPDNPDYPEVTTRYIEELGKEVPASKGVISLKNDRGTSYDMYIQVQNELARAFNEMKDEKSVDLFGLKYNALLDKNQIKAINKIVPVRVSEAEPEDIGGN